MNIRLDNTSEQNILNMLMDHSLINMDQMNKIKTMSKEIGKSILETAFELNFTSEKKILDILSTSYSLPVVELKSYKILVLFYQKLIPDHSFLLVYYS